MKRLLGLCLIVLCLGCGDSVSEKNARKEEKSIGITTVKTPAVFERVAGSTSGITFANNLKENVGTLENLFDFDYFYNGAGVAVIDINNDGLEDLFFAGNQVPNALYLNKGNLLFEDISATAGIQAGKQWANGVTVADVNGDGWLDIYVSQGGPRQQSNRKNVLLINQKDNSFRESATTYNIADTGISTQSVFFDYDKDGDLDLVVSNENEFYGLDPQRFFKQMERTENLNKSSVHFYENNGDSFEDITKKAGLLRPAFGLGVVVSDIDNDGWLDIYIANDYYLPDAMYINNKKGGFTESIKEQTKQVSFYGMGVDIADINNDNLQDIFVLDMAASDHVRSKTLMASMNEARFNMLVEDLDFAYQYMFNSLQLNQGNGKFHNVVQQANMAKTDWSWAGLIADLNNDTRKDVYVTNGYRRYALDNDLQNQVRETQRAFQGRVPLEAKQKLYDAMPTEKLSNIMFENKGNIKFENVAYQWGLALPSYSNGGVYADLDNDGDLELVVNNIDDEAFLFKNTTSEQQKSNFLRIKLKGNSSEPFAKVTINYGSQSQVFEAKRTKGYLSATENVAHFGLGDVSKIDKVTVQWLSGKTEVLFNIISNQVLTVSELDANQATLPVFEDTNAMSGYAFEKAKVEGLSFEHIENEFNDFKAEVLLPYKQSTLGPPMAKGDVNGDGLDDVFIGGASGQSGKLFVQTASGFVGKELEVSELDIYEDSDALFTDVDNDGDQDLIVLSGGNEFGIHAKPYANRLYLNDGKGNFVKRSLGVEGKVHLESSKSIVALDYDNDGDQDIIIGNRMEPGHYPKSVSSKVFRNEKGTFQEVTATVAKGLETFGIINKLIATDFDSDGDIDFIAVGEWTHVGMFQNTNGVFTDVSANYGLDREKGWWFTVAETDINKDGAPDYILGNIGANVKYKASVKKPFKVFADDFDDNGTFDLVLSNEYNGNYVPARGKECSTQQMPFISEKFETYNEFANATLDDIYGDKLKTAYQKSVTTFESKLLLSDGSGGFVMSALPAMAQTAPILDVVFTDLDEDGFEDAILVGNIYEAEVETPRYDNGSGMVLVSNHKDGYTVSIPASRGLYIEGNAKILELINHVGTGKQFLLAGINDGVLQIFEVN